MLKRKNLILVLAFAFTALLLIPFTASAAPVANPHKAFAAMTANYAFTALNTAGKETGASLTGVLALQSDNSGAITGSYRSPDDSTLPVKGMAKSDGSIELNIFEGQTALIHGLGKLNAQHMFVGTFQMNHKGKMSSGVWSAMLVMAQKVLALSFVGTIEKGTNKNVLLTSAIVVDSKTLKGSLLEATGVSFPVQIHKKTAEGVNKIQIIINNGSITAIGKQVDNPANKKNKGYVGNFTGPAKDDKGVWDGFIFTF